MSSQTPPAWSSRWSITGTLTTVSPLRIGDGNTRADGRVTYKVPDGQGGRTTHSAQISTVATDAAGRPYIPGSTLKGNLRAWAEAKGMPQAILDALFGSRNAGDPTSVGGKCEFHNSRYCESEPPREPPWWSAERRTGVRAGVAINRVTGTAEDKRLFYQEYVPAGIRFGVTITGQNLTDGEAAALLGALTGFSAAADVEAIALGASTGDGWGRLHWELEDVVLAGPDDVTSWLASAETVAARQIPGASRKNQLVPQTFAAQAEPDRIVIDLTVALDGPFLVNDPTQCGEGEGLPDHAPLRDDQGRAYLPASSIRGALRSQAERILRTIGGPGAACAATPAADGRKACRPVYDVEDVSRHLCPACQLFGAPGWRSPLEFSDFTGDAEDQNWRQDFVAIDRFTGGAAPGLKFDQMAALQPVLRGTVQVIFHRLGCVEGAWAAGLLGLLFRDLAEGDIPLGHGRTRGNGECRLEAWSVRMPLKAVLPEAWQGILDDDLPHEIGSHTGVPDGLRESLEFAVLELVGRAKSGAFARGGA